MKKQDIRTGGDYAWKKVGKDPVWCRVIGTDILLHAAEGDDSPKGSAITIQDGSILTVPNREIIDRWSDHLIKNDLRDEYVEMARQQRHQHRLERGVRALVVEHALRSRGVPEQPRPVSQHDSDSRETVAVDLAELGFNVYFDDAEQIPWVLTANSATPRVIVEGLPFVFTSHQMVWLLTTPPAGA